MELRQLRYFVAVAEERSFSRAALRLHVSQPPLSTQLKDLEAQLGVRLFERSNRGVTLTPAGQVFYDEVRGVLDRLEQAKLKARHAQQGDIGSLSIGFVSIADYGILPPAIQRFRSRYPGVEIQLHELTTDVQIREIQAGRLDLGIGLGPVEEPALSFTRVTHEHLVLAAPLAHPLLPASGAVALKSLANESFIIPPRDNAPGLYDLIISQCRAAGFTPRITQHARQMQTVISLVANGMGCALVPASVQNLKREGVQYRLLQGERATVELGILQPRASENPMSRNFATTLLSVAHAACAEAASH